jgi:hypothetical protein
VPEFHFGICRMTQPVLWIVKELVNEIERSVIAPTTLDDGVRATLKRPGTVASLNAVGPEFSI